VRCQTYGYLPSRTTLPHLGRYQIILLGDRGTCVRLCERLAYNLLTESARPAVESATFTVASRTLCPPRHQTTHVHARVHCSWGHGVVVSGVRRMNEVNARRALLVPGWAGIPSRYVTSQLGQLSLASLRGRLIEYQLRLGLERECHLCRVAGNTV